MKDSNMYIGRVVAFDDVTKDCTVVVPQLQGTSPLTCQAYLNNTEELETISAVPAGERVLVFFDGGDLNSQPYWMLVTVGIITADKIDMSLFDFSIPDGSITSTKIADNAIITPKLAANAVVTSKLTTDAIRSLNFTTVWEQGTADVTAGSSTLTSLPGSFESAMIGATVTISGAGPGGASLVTTITGYTSSSVVTIAAAVSTTVSGAGWVVTPRNNWSYEGAFLDLAQGNLTTPGLYADGVTGNLFIRGDVTASQLTITDDFGAFRALFQKGQTQLAPDGSPLPNPEANNRLVFSGSSLTGSPPLVAGSYSNLTWNNKKGTVVMATSNGSPGTREQQLFMDPAGGNGLHSVNRAAPVNPGVWSRSYVSIQPDVADMATIGVAGGMNRVVLGLGDININSDAAGAAANTFLGNIYLRAGTTNVSRDLTVDRDLTVTRNLTDNGTTTLWLSTHNSTATFNGGLTVNDYPITFNSIIGAKLNLYGTSYALGVASSTLYYDSSGAHRFYCAGTQRLAALSSGIYVTGQAELTTKLYSAGSYMTNSTSSSAWGSQVSQFTSTGQVAGISFWTDSQASVWRHFSGNGSMLECGNSAGNNYLPIGALSYVTRSSIVDKSNVRRDHSPATEAFRRIKTVTFDDSVGELKVAKSERFSELNKRWVASGKSPLRMNDIDRDSVIVEHDCEQNPCNGTAAAPCGLVRRHLNRRGIVAEELREVLPQAVVDDMQGAAIGIDYNVVLVEMVDVVQELVGRIEQLENQPPVPVPSGR